MVKSETLTIEAPLLACKLVCIGYAGGETGGDISCENVVGEWDCTGERMPSLTSKAEIIELEPEPEDVSELLGDGGNPLKLMVKSGSHCGIGSNTDPVSFIKVS